MIRHPRALARLHARTFSASNVVRGQQRKLDEEPLGNYRPGGYHPVTLGDHLDHGRYKIFHKLGWGGFSTVWAARDTESNKNVAIKILQAAASETETSELKMMRFIRDHQHGHPGYQHLATLHESFHEKGPNGVHQCLVMDLTGPSVQDFMARHTKHGRLPGRSAISIARQTLQAISCLHQQDIGHGDLHIRNLVIGSPDFAVMSESELMGILGHPVTEPVTSSEGEETVSNIPKHIVKPATFRSEDTLDLGHVKLVDFGASFQGELEPRSLLNPSILRPPEAIFGDPLNKQVDLWSMGCTLFELITGRPPFISPNDDIEEVTRQMLQLVQDGLPERWAAQRDAVRQTEFEPECSDLQQLLESSYAQEHGHRDLTKDDLQAAGRLVSNLLRFEPGERISAEQVLSDPWLSD